MLLFLLTCTHSSFVQFTSFTSRHTISSFMLSYTLAACPRGSYFMEDTYTIHELHNLIYCYTWYHLDFWTDTAAAAHWETPADSSSAIQDPRCSHCIETLVHLCKSGVLLPAEGVMDPGNMLSHISFPPTWSNKQNDRAVGQGLCPSICFPIENQLWDWRTDGRKMEECTRKHLSEYLFIPLHACNRKHIFVLTWGREKRKCS